MGTFVSKRSYTPQFSEMATIAVRRLAWALDRNMVQAVNELVSYLPQLVVSSKVCLACKDNTKCRWCIFNGSTVPQSALSEIVN
jgi:hypothetical protein